MQFIQMSYADWATEFKPIKNPNKNHYDEYEYETYDEDRELVMAARRENPRCIWTHIDTAEGEVIVNGFCAVNRLGYFITEKAYPVNTDYNVE